MNIYIRTYLEIGLLTVFVWCVAYFYRWSPTNTCFWPKIPHLRGRLDSIHFIDGIWCLPTWTAMISNLNSKQWKRAQINIKLNWCLLWYVSVHLVLEMKKQTLGFDQNVPENWYRSYIPKQKVGEWMSLYTYPNHIPYNLWAIFHLLGIMSSLPRIDSTYRLGS